MENIPDELLPEILKRLSAEDVFNCILLCKSWYSLINHPHFFKQHLQFHGGHGFLIQKTTEAETPHDTRVVFTKEGQSFTKKIDYIGDWAVAASCNGLLLLTEFKDFPALLRITNPITKFTLNLPPIDPIGKHYAFAFAYVPSTGNYYVLYIYTCDESVESKNVEFQILEINVGQDLQGLKWEKVPSNVQIPDFNFENGEPGLYLDRGMLVWDVGLRSHCAVFDLTARKIYSLQLPGQANNDDDRFHLVNQGGSLALIDYPIDDTILRIFTLDAEGNRWIGKWYFSVESLREELEAEADEIIPIYISEEGDSIVFFWSNRFFQCHRRTGEVWEIQVEGTRCLSHCTHIDTLFSLKKPWTVEVPAANVG